MNPNRHQLLPLLPKGSLYKSLPLRWSQQRLQQLLAGEPLEPLQGETWCGGTASGPLLAGNLTVDNALVIATQWGVPELLIGLTILALGTSLPELVTSIAAALRNEASLALGNVVGSNIINVLFILPVTALVDQFYAQVQARGGGRSDTSSLMRLLTTP